MNSRILAFFAAFGATTIYGLNHTIAKVVMPHYIGPFGFIMLIVFGAGFLFWLVSLFIKNEKMSAKSDLTNFCEIARVSDSLWALLPVLTRRTVQKWTRAMPRRALIRI